MRLARPADRITVGEVVRRTEEGFELADCSGCALSPACGLTGVLAEGMQAMMAVFDSYTIADLLTDRDVMRRLIERHSPLGVGRFCANQSLPLLLRRRPPGNRGSRIRNMLGTPRSEVRRVGEECVGKGRCRRGRLH